MSHKRPPTFDEAVSQRLTTDDKHGVYTFSNGSQWDCWADGNCYECRFYDPDAMGAKCAFEAAAFLHMVTPELARLFGWMQDAQWDKPDDHRNGWDAPQECPFLWRKDDDSDQWPIVDPDPSQLVLLADPTEDAAPLNTAPIEVPAFAHQGEPTA